LDMPDKPELNKIGVSQYACTFCPHFQIEIVKKMNPGQLQKHLDKRFGQHIKKYHADKDFSQATARILREATERFQ